jgi:hypothetical protein
MLTLDQSMHTKPRPIQLGKLRWEAPPKDMTTLPAPEPMSGILFRVRAAFAWRSAWFTTFA